MSASLRQRPRSARFPPTWFCVAQALAFRTLARGRPLWSEDYKATNGYLTRERHASKRGAATALAPCVRFNLGLRLRETVALFRAISGVRASSTGVWSASGVKDWAATATELFSSFAPLAHGDVQSGLCAFPAFDVRFQAAWNLAASHSLQAHQN
jgi:hypothetical protein